MSSKCKMHQSKYSDFTDVIFDVRRVHVSDSLLEPITLRKSSEPNQTSGKRWQKDKKTY